MAARILLVPLVLLVTAVASAAKPQVSLELVTEPGFPITGAQQWMELLTKLGVGGVQIRQGNARDEVSLEKLGSKDAPRYKVVGILTATSELHVPKARFTLRDQAKLRQWLDQLGDQGVEGVTQARSAFGLLPKQLAEVNEDLKQSVNFSTKGLETAKAVGQVTRRLKFKLVVDSEVAEAVKELKVAEELQGLSSGTALAVLLRPAGLVLEPERPAGGELRYRIGKPRSGREVWPVGWKTEESWQKVMPKLFEFINVEISEIPAAEAVEAIRGRLDMPMFYDQNALALHDIDPAKIEVSLPGKRLTYSLILQKLLSQARLKPELRLDEAGKPFFWITTIKPS